MSAPPFVRGAAICSLESLGDAFSIVFSEGQGYIDYLVICLDKHLGESPYLEVCNVLIDALSGDILEADFQKSA